MPRFECLIKQLAAVENQSELYDVLDSADIGEGDMSKTRYDCTRCAIGVTVEYPDLTESVETTGIHLGSGALSRCLSATVKEEIKTLQTRFESTEPVQR